MEILPNGRKQVVIEKPFGYANVNYVEGDYILENILADMDQAGIDVGILKLPCYHEWLSLELCKNLMMVWQTLRNGQEVVCVG